MIYETVGTFCPFVGRHSAVGLSVTAKVGEKEETADHRKKRMAGWIEPLSTLCHLEPDYVNAKRKTGTLSSHQNF